MKIIHVYLLLVLVVVSKAGAYDDHSVLCTIDSDCDEPFFKCDTAAEDPTCIHKPLFPLLTVEIIGTIILPFLIAMANAGGIGGGGIIVPMCMLFFSFGTKEAVAVSTFTIFVSSVTRFIFNFKQKHPRKDTVAIDYGLATVMLPTVMLGSLLGVLFNILLPELIILVALTVVLIFLASMIALKLYKVCKRENLHLKEL